MKITPEHFEVIKSHVESSPIFPLLTNYLKAGLSAKRYRWDCLWKSGLKIGDGCGMTGLPIYAYADDDHIDTALRKITGTS